MRDRAERGVAVVEFVAPRRARDQRGVAAVEFALVVPILAMLLLGTVSVALAYSGKVALVNATREGARVGASVPAGSTWASSVTSQVASAYADPDTTGLSICASLYKVGNAVPLQTGGVVATCGDEPPAPAGVTSGCYVKVWASKPTDLVWVLGSATVTVKAQSVAAYNRSTPC